MSPADYISGILENQFCVCPAVAGKSASNIITNFAIGAGVSVQTVQKEHENSIKQCFDECFKAARDAHPEIIVAFEREMIRRVFSWTHLHAAARRAAKTAYSADAPGRPEGSKSADHLRKP